ncbi:ribosomal protein S18-alanine N-acetyltransferase [Bacteroides sp. 51]|uniref:ribosomal protein S18-alanine N-acetyltransferase n=1 Tax=Bacteroides sp. 51 TaxID=2302938 RepID=UPI00194031FC|nr:ribosomal protein S18-alanine N-acetyltransferase [Bacteroides sp. 51]NDV82274.1 ribosomal-protein-alanine N-acetyltransferase [Bacteroides sp. 51]
MNTAILVERISLSDLSEVMEIENACFGVDAFSRRQMFYLMTYAKGTFLVARHDGQLAGYIALITSRRHNTGRVYSIAVSPQYRGQGVGSALLNKAIKYAHIIELKAIFLEVRMDNDSAISLYEKKGFTKRSIRLNYYEDGADAYSMVLGL